MWLAVGLSVFFVVLFIVAYRHFRGFYPGSTIVEMPAMRDPSAPRLLFFYTTWCPHSQTALAEWRSLKELLKGKTLGGKRLQYVPYDGDAEQGATARYGVDAYPTFILETVDKVITYEGHAKASRLRGWLIGELGEEVGELKTPSS